jgi:DNA-binding transcriptional LysR family regulator
MELRQLAHFLAVAEELHFTRAAARVHVVQSSLSASIGALERELGDALFIRDSRRVALTPAGRALVPAARRALDAAEEACDAVAGVRGELRGTLHVGAIQTLGVLDLAELLSSYHRSHPDVTIRLSHDSAAELARQAADSILDIAFIDGPTDPKKLTRIELGSDNLILAVPADDPLPRRVIRLDNPALRDRDFVDYRADSALRAQVDTACAAAGLARRTSCEASNMQYLGELVRAGMGIAIIPPAAIKWAGDQIRAIPIEPPIRRDMCAVFAANRLPTAPAQALLDLLPQTPAARRPPHRAASPPLRHGGGEGCEEIAWQRSL